MPRTASFADARIVHQNNGVVLYGAGSVGKDVSEALHQAGIPIACALDRRGRGALGDIDVYAPDGCPIPMPRRERIPMVLSAFNRDRPQVVLVILPRLTVGAVNNEEVSS
jgi:hypothetical protein